MWYASVRTQKYIDIVQLCTHELDENWKVAAVEM